VMPPEGCVLMTEPLPTLLESPLQIAWDFLDASGEIEDPQQTAEVLLGTIKSLQGPQAGPLEPGD